MATMAKEREINGALMVEEWTMQNGLTPCWGNTRQSCSWWCREESRKQNTNNLNNLCFETDTVDTNRLFIRNINNRPNISLYLICVCSFHIIFGFWKYEVNDYINMFSHWRINAPSFRCAIKKLSWVLVFISSVTVSLSFSVGIVIKLCRLLCEKAPCYLLMNCRMSAANADCGFHSRRAQEEQLQQAKSVSLLTWEPHRCFGTWLNVNLQIVSHKQSLDLRLI